MAQYQNSLQLIFRSTVVACGQKSQKNCKILSQKIYTFAKVYFCVHQSAGMKRCDRNSRPSTTIATKTVLQFHLVCALVIGSNSCRGSKFLLHCLTKVDMRFSLDVFVFRVVFTSFKSHDILEHTVLNTTYYRLSA